MTSGPRLAVLVKGWPRLSETFIAQELVALEDAGVTFDLWSLRHPTDKKTHPLHDRLKASVHYLPEYLHQEPLRVLRGMTGALLTRRFAQAFGVFWRDLLRDFTRNRVRRFGQACVLAREAGPDIAGFYAHFLHTPSSVARYAAILRGTPWSFAAHAKDIWTSPDWELTEKLGPNAGAAFGVTCTAFGAAHLRGLATRTHVDLAYHGLDLTRFPDPPARRQTAKPLKLLSVGRLVEKKGFDRLIDALNALPDDLDWHWTHIGGGTLGPALKDRAERYGMSDRIAWRGACDQPEVIDAMRAADLFVLPSRIAEDGDRDGLPNVLMEAASQKLPILSTPVSAIPEFIEDGVHGLLRGDAPEEISAAIQEFAADPALGPCLAEAAYERLTRDFEMNAGIALIKARLDDLTGEAA